MITLPILSITCFIIGFTYEFTGWDATNWWIAGVIVYSLYIMKDQP